MVEEKLMRLGSQLSIEINCVVRYPAYDKRMFECGCGVTFPLFIVEGENWEMAKEKHQREGRKR